MRMITKEAAIRAGKAAAMIAKKSYMEKKAEDPSSFNETVPQIGPNTDSQFDYYGSQGGIQPKKNTMVQEAGQQDQYAAVPAGFENPTAGAGMPTPPPEMISAAQSFLGPEVMQAASQGDPAAMDLLARTAAHVGVNFSHMMNQQNSVAPMTGGSELAPTDAVGGTSEAVPGNIPGTALVGITSPEEDIVNELVPNIAPQPQAQAGIPATEQNPGTQGAVEQQQTYNTEAGNEQPGNLAQGTEAAAQQSAQSPTDHIHVDVVAKLLDLARQGKL